MSAGLSKEVQALAQVLKALEGLSETDQRWVLRSALSKLGPQDGPDESESDTGEKADEKKKGDISPKKFLQTKKPTTDVQRVACLAYYLTHHRDTPHFTTKDLTDLNVEAAGTPIGNASQAAQNATRQSQYLAPAGGRKSQITGFGEDVVGALPNPDAVKEIEKNRPRKRRRGRGKRKARSKR